MNKSVIKALNLLEYFKETTELTLAELSEMAETPKPTVYRLVSSLEASGFLIRTKYTNHDVTYRLGLKLLELGGFVADQLDYRKVALPHMVKLNDEVNEAVHLAVIDGNDVVYIEAIDSKKPIRLHSRIGSRVPIHAGSAPKLLLAFLDEEDQAEMLESIHLQRFTSYTITDKETLKKELAAIKKEGFSMSKGEYFEDTLGYSFPVFNHLEKVIAALVVSIPEMTISKEWELEIISNTKKAAKEISLDLGYK